MFTAEEQMTTLLKKREEENALRTLSNSINMVDFCSNDYLGFARSNELKSKIIKFSNMFNDQMNVGSTGSRLISGNTMMVLSLESMICTHHNAEAALVFNSGYDANIGIFSAVPQRGDTIIYDELVHASIRDGIRLGFATNFSFQHNDLENLREKFALAKGTIFVAVESVYSMDGDFAPLKELVQLCDEFKANLIVDEAHATGVFGIVGKGRVSELYLEKKVFARVHTFGKAMGVHGAAVLGSNNLRNFLINYARPFIYTTALPPHSCISIKCAYDLLSESDEAVEELLALIAYFKERIATIPNLEIIESISPIQSIIISGNDKVKAVASAIQKKSFDVRPILSPTVPKGKERIRICLHAYNTKDEINRLVESIREAII